MTKFQCENCGKLVWVALCAVSLVVVAGAVHYTVGDQLFGGGEKASRGEQESSGGKVSSPLETVNREETGGAAETGGSPAKVAAAKRDDAGARKGEKGAGSAGETAAETTAAEDKVRAGDSSSTPEDAVNAEGIEIPLTAEAELASEKTSAADEPPPKDGAEAEGPAPKEEPAEEEEQEPNKLKLPGDQKAADGELKDLELEEKTTGE